MLSSSHPAGEQPVLCRKVLRGYPAGHRSPRLFGHFELNGAARLLLKDHDALLHATDRNQITDFETYEVTASQLAVYRQIEESEVAGFGSDLKPNTDAPHVNWL